MTAGSAAMVDEQKSGSRARWLAWASVALYVALAGISIGLETRAVGRVFFFQAEDGIRDVAVTGVQTCALPICSPGGESLPTPFSLLLPLVAFSSQSPSSFSSTPVSFFPHENSTSVMPKDSADSKIGRASCRERV